MDTILITGGAGFVGSHTVDVLLAHGHTVTVFDIKPWLEAKNLHHVEGRVRYVQGDICDRGTLASAIEGHTRVLHLAAIVSVPRTVEDPIGSHAVNVTGTLNVFESARQHGVKRVVYASSAAVYGDPEVVPIRESMTLSPQSPYGVHKAINDAYAKLYAEMYQQSILGLRYFNIFGTRQDPHSPYSGVISIFLLRAMRGEAVSVYGDGTQTRDFVSVRDVAFANYAALMGHETGVINIGTGKETSLNQLITILESLSHKQIQTTYDTPREGDIARSCADITCARTLLHFEPHDTLEGGLKAIVDTYHI